LIRISAPDSRTALTHAADALAAAFQADKVDVFLHDRRRDSLVAIGTSVQPLSALQKQLGLDILPISNGGRVVHVYTTRQTFMTGALDQDHDELKGVKEGLKIRSKLGIPLFINGDVRGMVMIASLKPDFFTEADRELAEAAVQWVGFIAHRSELAQSIEENALAQGRRTVAEELITELAHDLRNYLSPISGRLFALRIRADKEHRNADREDAQAALRAVDRLKQLINNILDVARLDQGSLHLDMEPLDIVEMVGEAAAVLKTKAHAIDVRATDSFIINADKSRIRQCVENLLANAIGHSPDDASVDVFIAPMADEGKRWVKLEVIDEGPGVPEDLVPHVFDRFATGRPKVGLGLGLFVAKRLATAHGGDLSVDRYPGKGARFTLTLPLFEG
jgi:signal transduction histidine kinase